MNDLSPFAGCRVWVCPHVVSFTRETADAFLKFTKKGKTARHMRGPMEAARDFAVGLLFTYHNFQPFKAPERTPWILVIGDDGLVSLGPSGFHENSLRELLSQCAFVAIVCGEAIPRAYNMAATFSSRDRQNTAVVETQPEHRDAWFALVREVRPDAHIEVSGPQEMV
jgi:hypothetical protein